MLYQGSLGHSPTAVVLLFTRQRFQCYQRPHDVNINTTFCSTELPLVRVSIGDGEGDRKEDHAGNACGSDKLVCN